jgi:hypothetical protein
MADVSVEFGAKDTGLEQTLKTVQAQLTSLEEEVKSGTLSFDELQQTMRKISQAEKVQDQLQAMATSMGEAGNAASTAEPKLDALGNEATDMGNKVQGAGQKTSDSAGLFDAGFAKISAAFAVGNLAAKGFEAIVNGVFSAARAVVDGFGDALDLGGRLDDLSKRTGETAGSLFILEGAFKEAGLSADQVGTTINKLQNFMQDAANGGERQTATMNKLGISLEQLAGKTPTQQMEIFAQKIAGIQDPTQRAATASEVFGEKLGGKLLPLLLEFPQTLDNVRDRTGGMADVMDESAATFARAGDTIDAVEGKLTQFAAGILSETIPALESLGASVEEVDAAGLGQKVGEVLAPALQRLSDATTGALVTLQKLAEAEKAASQDTGILGTAYTKTKDTAIAFYNAMNDLFGAITPHGIIMNHLAMEGEGLRVSQIGAADAVDRLYGSATSVAPALDGASGSTERFATSLQDIGTDSGQAFTDINSGATTFKSLIDEGNISLSDMSGEIGGQIPLQTEQIALVGELNTSLGEANEKAGEQLAKIEQQVAAEQARNEKIAERQEKSAADYNLQIQINEALAAGNLETAKSLEYNREIGKLIEKIMRDTGLARKEAEGLAVNLLNSKAAAEETAKSTEPISNNIKDAADEADNAAKNIKTVGDLIKDANKEEMDNPPKALIERTKEARNALGEMKDFIGQDMNNMSLADIVDKLGLDVPGLTNTREQLDHIEKAVKTLEDADPADLTPNVDAFGVNAEIDKVKEYLKQAEQDKADMTPEIDQSKIKNAAGEAKGIIESQEPEIVAKVDQAALDDAVSELQAEISNEFTGGEGGDGGEGGGGGQGGAGGDAEAEVGPLERIANNIERIVRDIERKLPMQALA